MNKKIIIGTAGFQKNYGITQRPRDNPTVLLESSIESGYLRYDTAESYCGSEVALGKEIQNSGIGENLFFIDSKISGLTPNSSRSPSIVRDKVLRILDRLRISKLYTLYLHQTDIGIISDYWIREGVEQLKESGLITRSGISVYDVEAVNLFEQQKCFDDIQLPYNVLNRSLFDRLSSFSRCNRAVGRSVFLQGLLVSRPELAAKITGWPTATDVIQKLHLRIHSKSLSLSDYIGAFPLVSPELNRVIYGVNSISTLKALNKIIEFSESIKFGDYTDIVNMDVEQEWIDPRNWKSTF